MAAPASDDAEHRHRHRCPAFVPPIPGIEDVGYLTSDNVWNLRKLPGDSSSSVAARLVRK
jgi:hypothetical protein